MRPTRSKSTSSGQFFERVYALVGRIPPGRVASYGQIALRLGNPRGARSVGWAMRALSADRGVPWQRVVNARGTVSLSGRSGALQRALLEAEGVEFDHTGRIPMGRFAWDPDAADPGSR